MLTKGDDYPLHQTSEPIAYSGTDRNFYDRYFFNGYAPNGSGYFAVAFGVYPHVNIADAHFAAVREGKEYCVHASRFLNMERMDLQVGPIRIEIIEPLKRLRVTVENVNGVSASLEFEGLAFPIEEPRFTHRFGPRAFMDYTRMTQGGQYTGWIEIDGDRRAIAHGSVGVRDRSWGVRPIGSFDAQPFAPAIIPGFYWTWAPMRIGNATVLFHKSADGEGLVWNMRAARARDGNAVSDIVDTTDCRVRHTLGSGTRYPIRSEIEIRFPGEAAMTVEVTPQYRFLMRGIGYFHPDWQHGGYKGELVVEREDIDLATADPRSGANFHVQAFSHIVVRHGDGHEEAGIGVLESLIQGPCPEFGLVSNVDFPA